MWGHGDMGKTGKELTHNEGAETKVQAEYAMVLSSSPFLQCGSGLRDQNSGDAGYREVSR